jgi:hypothetical protein
VYLFEANIKVYSREHVSLDGLYLFKTIIGNIKARCSFDFVLINGEWYIDRHHSSKFSGVE